MTDADKRAVEEIRKRVASGESDVWAVEDRSTLLRLLDGALRECEGERKAKELLSAGMASQCELMDGLKQEVRTLRGGGRA